MAVERRPRLLVLAGGTTPTAAAGVEQVIGHLRREQAGTVVVHHDLREVGTGVVHRRLRFGRTDDHEALELAHGCVSCTLREDVLPLLVGLARKPGVTRIVLHLDPVLEPEQVCWALLHVLVEPPRVLQIDAPAERGRDPQVGSVTVADVVDLRGVITVLDADTWFDDATCDDDVAERGLALLPDDERTLAQLVVGQAEFADAIVYAGAAEPWQAVRTDAVLARLAPRATRVPLDRLDRTLLLDDPSAGARRGRPDHPHAPLLYGEPSLTAQSGVGLALFTARRPFHPQRLHRSLDALLTGVVRARGRIWLATRPDSVLWLESAGGGLQIGHVGDWLAAGGDDDWEQAHPERRAAAALRWHPRWGDRLQEITILTHDAHPADIEHALHSALLDDDEVAAGDAAWSSYPDPFGWWHTDPCDDLASEPAARGIVPDHPAHEHPTPDQEEKS